jgi:hypothetical protein
MQAVRIQSKVADLERLVCPGRSDNICAVLPQFSDAELFNSFLVVLAWRAEPGPNIMIQHHLVRPECPSSNLR